MAYEYVSPLMNRVKNDSEELSLDTLKKYVPLVQKGYEAQAQLDDHESKLSAQERRQLSRTILQGESAKEKLFLIALPLIRSMALAEYNKRQSWNSKVSLEDLFSDGLSGFLRGIKAYNVDGAQKSATNYIGQWITTEMRRNADTMDQDFFIPGEAVERHRKIRAIRSRLTDQLDREPTDQEIVDAAMDKSFAGGTFLGRSRENKIKEAESERPRRRIITLKHVEEERQHRNRTGTIKSINQVASNEDEHVLTESSFTSVIGDEDHDNFSDKGHSEIDARAARIALSQLLENAFIIMEIGRMQSDIIRRRFGLVPYMENQTLKDIVIHTGIPKHKVTRILTAFSAEMTRKNSPFHELINSISVDETESMGIGWVHKSLGTFTPPATPNVNRELKESMVTQNKIVRDTPKMVSYLVDNDNGVLAQFYCEYEDFTYAIAYISRDSVPTTRTCPRCQRQSSYQP